MAAPDFYNVAPDCIQHGLPGGVYGSAEIMKPFQDCAGFFTAGPGSVLNDKGDFVGANGGLWALTVIGFVVSIAFIVAWVWTEHHKLMDRAEKLRAAGRASGAP